VKTIEINPDPDVQVRQITEDSHCVIVDNFLRNPEAIVEFACTNAEKFETQKIGYPGVLYDVDRTAMNEVQRFIRSHMSRQFSFLKGDIRTTTYLSMATKQPGELAPLQRLCHTDPRERIDRRNYAGLVYLFDNEVLGGTGFYRWKEQKRIEAATALELERPGSSLAFLQEHFEMYRGASQYMCGSNEVAELLLHVPARFNRFVFYSGEIPHSAHIPQSELLSADFSMGRLTLNCFTSVRYS
jgi:hypothetical protein